jgi:predicted transposase/invertase (TIGR01784 family)
MARDEGHQEGFEVGRQEGIKNGIIKTAKAMLKKGMNQKDIIEITGLTKEEIETISNDMD